MLTVHSITALFTICVCGSLQGHGNLKSLRGSSVKDWLMLCRSWNLRQPWLEGKDRQEPKPSCATLAYCEIMAKQLRGALTAGIPEIISAAVGVADHNQEEQRTRKSKEN